MKKLASILKHSIIIAVALSITVFIFIIVNPVLPSHALINLDNAANFGSFFGGVLGTMASLISALLVAYTFITQYIENKKNATTTNFFKMVDYHNLTVTQLNVAHIDPHKKHKILGRRAFVIFKMQIGLLLKEIKDINNINNLELSKNEIAEIAYIIFFYGAKKEFNDFILKKLEAYHGSEIIVNTINARSQYMTSKKLGRTNQTSVSPYFRNMLNTIRLVDEDSMLDDDEKRSLIDVYWSQISDTELYVLFFSIILRKNYEPWSNYIDKYGLFKHLEENPDDYLNGYTIDDLPTDNTTPD